MVTISNATLLNSGRHDVNVPIFHTDLIGGRAVPATTLDPGRLDGQNPIALTTLSDQTVVTSSKSIGILGNATHCCLTCLLTVSCMAWSPAKVTGLHTRANCCIWMLHFSYINHESKHCSKVSRSAVKASRQSKTCNCCLPVHSIDVAWPEQHRTWCDGHHFERSHFQQVMFP